MTLYDKNGRLTDTIQNPVYRNGSFTVDVTKSIVMTNKYDARGNLVEETDGKGNKTIYEYNEEIDWLRPALTMEQEHQTIQFMNMIYKIR
mgnify:CR=1 FL=1